MLQPTGGTTGSLKVAELSHRNLISNATQVSVWSNLRPGQERFLTVLPLFHVYGLTLCMLACVSSASEMIMTTRFDAEQVLNLQKRYRPTIYPLVPTMCEALCQQLESMEFGATWEGARLCISGAAPLPVALAERFQRLTGMPIIEGYGLTEAAPVTHANLIVEARAAAIGLPMPDTQVRVVDLVDSSKDAG